MSETSDEGHKYHYPNTDSTRSTIEIRVLAHEFGPEKGLVPHKDRVIEEEVPQHSRHLFDDDPKA